MQGSTIAELRSLRDEIRRCHELMAKRNRLIQASKDRYPQRRVAQASGLSQSRVSKIQYD